MSIEHSDDYSFLDKVRINSGNDKCGAVFQEACESGRQGAIDLLNDEKITFPCLFILLPQINSFHLDTGLNPINSIVIGVVRQILNGENTDSHTDYLGDKTDAVHSALKWILRTGSNEYELGGSYNKVLDIVVSVLINTYKEKSILPIVDDMIFNRRKKECNLHDLVWAFFRIHDSDVLKLAAAHILSPDREEAKFARELLNIEAFIGKEDNDPKKQYKSYLNWLEENGSSLRFTGESYQFASRPVMYATNSKTEGQK